MDEHQVNTHTTGAPGTEEGPAPPLDERERMKRPWRWVLGAVSIAAVGVGIIFISKRGLRKPEQPSP